VRRTFLNNPNSVFVARRAAGVAASTRMRSPSSVVTLRYAARAVFFLPFDVHMVVAPVVGESPTYGLPHMSFFVAETN
jgi:hypothetical protein